MTIFDRLLEDLSEALDTPLYSDERNVCRIEINEVIQVQLEVDRLEQFLIIVCDICEVPPGNYRADVFKNALRACHGQNQMWGILSFIPKTNTLMLHQKLPLETIVTDDLVQFLIQFSSKANEWRNAIKEGRLMPPGALHDTAQTPGGPITPGIKP